MIVLIDDSLVWRQGFLEAAKISNPSQKDPRIHYTKDYIMPLSHMADTKVMVESLIKAGLQVFCINTHNFETSDEQSSGRILMQELAMPPGHMIPVRPQLHTPLSETILSRLNEEMGTKISKGKISHNWEQEVVAIISRNDDVSSFFSNQSILRLIVDPEADCRISSLQECRKSFVSKGYESYDSKVPPEKKDSTELENFGGFRFFLSDVKQAAPLIIEAAYAKQMTPFKDRN